MHPASTARKLLFAIFGLLSGAVSTAQTSTLTLASMEVCAAQEVVIPVMASNIYNVGAITLYITFDTASIEYLALENIDPQIAGLNVNFVSSPPQLVVVWSSINPATFPDTKWFDIRLQYLQGSTQLTFTPECEIGDINSQIIPVSFSDGAVNSMLPQITQQPQNAHVLEGQQAQFLVISPNATQYFWRESRDQGLSWIPLQDGGVYQGVHTPLLSISPVPDTFNQFIYRCLVVRTECPLQSENAWLLVDTLVSSDHSPDLSSGHLVQYPNPVADITTFSFFLPEEGIIKLTVFTPIGETAAELSRSYAQPGPQSIRFDAGTLSSGFYLCRVTFTGPETGFSLATRMIKL